MKVSGLLRRGFGPALYVLVPLTLYLTGWHTEVLGCAQQALLATGLFQPQLAPASTQPQADYSLPLRTLDGRLTTLAELRGQPILLNLWATWCPPCVAEMPGLQRLHDKLRGQKIALVLLSMDENPEKARRFAVRRGFTMPIYTLAGDVPAVFNTESIPTTYIISPTGTIVARHEGMANYNSPEMLQFLQQLAR
ncbi:TlpA family protein disulfide reductase [Hymenobacter weizhouensis]|uniref:TlpA family protein disulfide reductase n=1 Tax=Hymenobacter sp. YIM 151500-1 TaxID=2987689 RepID=UPI00222695B6|nr:TlpA disulfide reductase family protein [Hymenobacter sp. YIM 151500-1]UYZ64868.1 TlpA family protein disulfide reductase [Hymenobacter sp. YIM 151500-1]